VHAEGPVRLAIRGRGTRLFEPEEELLVSAQGLAVPAPAPAHQVRDGDWIGIAYGGQWTNEPAILPPFAERPLRGSEKRILISEVMTCDLAFLRGAYFSEGHTSRSNWTVTITNSVEDVLERARQSWWDVFAIQARISRPRNRCLYVAAASKRLVEFMDQLGVGGRASSKAVPACILHGTREHAISFLQGAALDAYTTTTNASKWAICLESGVAIDGLQDLLTKLAIPNAQIAKFNRKMNKTYFELYASGRAGQKVCRVAPFLEPSKRMRAERYMAKSIGADNSDIIPGIAGLQLYDLVPRGTSGPNGRGSGRQALRHLRDPRTTRVCRSSVRCARQAGAVLPHWLERLLDAPVRFAPVVGVQRGRKGARRERLSL